MDGRALRVIGFAGETGIRELYVDPVGPECFVAVPLTEPVRASITFWEQTVQTP